MPAKSLLAQDAWHGLANVFPAAHTGASERMHSQSLDAGAGAGAGDGDGDGDDTAVVGAAAFRAAIESAQQRGTAVIPFPRHFGGVEDHRLGSAGAAM